MYFAGRGATIYYRRAVAGKTGQDKQDTSAVEPVESTESSGQSSVLDTITQSLRNALPSSTPSTGKTEDIVIGSLGILHPSVLERFSLTNPCSSLEFNAEPFL